jgi:hypothetical protein
MKLIHYMEYVKKNYDFLCSSHSDINEHLPTLFNYTKDCESVIELGVRGCVSSWAFLYGLLNNNKNVKKMLLNDLTECNVNELVNVAKSLNVDIHYKWVNDLDLEVDGMYDLTFIDTWHIYGQLKRELNKFSKITKKYIIMHDTEIDGIQGETIRNNWDAVKQSQETGFKVEEINTGLQKAIDEFLESNHDWKIKQVFKNNNGLTILERI